MNAVKTNLKRLRLAKKLTQDDLAEKLHVVRQTVSSWETGKTTPDVEMLTAIAQALEVDITELIYGPRPEDSAAAQKKNHLRRTVYLCLLTAALTVLAGSWNDILQYFGISGMISPATFRPVPRNVLLISFGTFFLPSLAYALAGVALAMVVGIYRPIFPQSRAFRVVLFVLGAAVLLLYWGQIIYFISMWLSEAAQTQKVFAVDTRLLMWLLERQYVFFPCGSLIALGGFRKMQ